MDLVEAVEAHDMPQRRGRTCVGDHVTVGRRDTTWPAFVHVDAATGSGWVPSRCLSADHGPATVTTEYDATELPTRVGEVLEVLERNEPSGWLWCRGPRGSQGLVPVTTVRAHPTRW